jgi:hypothetical protein
VAVLRRCPGILPQHLAVPGQMADGGAYTALVGQPQRLALILWRRRAHPLEAVTTSTSRQARRLLPGVRARRTGGVQPTPVLVPAGCHSCQHRERRRSVPRRGARSHSPACRPGKRENGKGVGESGAVRGLHAGEGVRVGERLRREMRVHTLRLVEIASLIVLSGCVATHSRPVEGDTRSTGQRAAVAACGGAYSAETGSNFAAGRRDGYPPRRYPRGGHR